MTKAAELAKMGEVLTNSQIGGRRNMIINGAMQVAVRGTSFTSVSGSAYHLDRFRTGMGDTTARFTVTQATAALNGFANSLKYDCTTAESSLSSADARLFIQHRLEGQDLQHLKKGTSDAEKVTVSFYVKTNKSGVYTVELYDNDNTRSISQTITVSDANWNRYTLTFDGDTTGTLDNDNGNSFNLIIHLIAGTTYTGGTFSTSWSSATDNTRVSSSNVNIGDSTDNNFEITGIQLEVGSQATPFEHLSYGETLSLAQRYCFDINPSTGASPNTPYIMPVAIYNDTLAISQVNFPCEMRTTPTTTLTGAAADFSIVEGNQTRVCTGFAANGMSSVGGGMTWTVNAGGMTTANAGNVFIESNKRAFFDAEL